MIARIWKGETPETKADQYFLLSLWESWDAIREFAGNDVEKAFYYPEDPEYLLSMQPEAEHYEVLLPLNEKDFTA